jgi:hypothetical protein
LRDLSGKAARIKEREGQHHKAAVVEDAPAEGGEPTAEAGEVAVAAVPKVKKPRKDKKK